MLLLPVLKLSLWLDWISASAVILFCVSNLEGFSVCLVVCRPVFIVVKGKGSAVGCQKRGAKIEKELLSTGLTSYEYGSLLSTS